MNKSAYLILTSLLSLVFVNAAFADKVEPPKDAVPFRGSHYKAFLDTNSTWWEAKFACDDLGEAFKFKNWDAKQPSATQGYNFQILNGKNGKWADTTDFSGKVKGYVCEWKGTAPKDAGPKDAELKTPKASN